MSKRKLQRTCSSVRLLCMFHNIYTSCQNIYRTCKFHWSYRQGPSWITRFTALTHSVGTGRRICKPCDGSTNTSWCFKALLGQHPGICKFSKKRTDITHNTCKFFSYSQKSLEVTWITDREKRSFGTDYTD